MKYYYLTFSFFFLCCIARAQNAASYNFYCNRAELHISDALYDSALVNYGKAFSGSAKPFARDFYNASLCAVKINKFSLAGEYLYKLAELGFVVDSLQTKKGFQSYVSSAAYQQLKEKTGPGKIQVVKNVVLKRALEELVQDDQHFRIRNPGDYMKHEYAAIIRQLDSINSYKLINLINEFGYPNESGIGLYKNQLASSLINPIIQHQQHGSPTRVVDFAPILLDAIKKGTIMVNHGIALYSLTAGRDSLFGTGSFFYVQQPDGAYKYAYYAVFTNGLEEKFNANRASFNMENLTDYRKKMIFFLKQHEFMPDLIMGVTIDKIDKTLAPYFKNLTYID
ncbi:MAG: hypothetical protein EOO13_10270 [Chitinophagaceae bacterium]|nr:MAG: hypothetical protein EOO13_10270 [Chitinophagaceae bacterium]